MVARIPDQYMRLDWDKDFRGEQETKDRVAMYLDKWDAAKRDGMGMEFLSPRQGVGKTFGATHIGRELVKAGERVLFAPFSEVIRSLEVAADREFEERARDTTVLILDEVTPPPTIKASSLFANRFEAIIRHRTNYNRPIIMTTNMTHEDLEEQYPRTYSLLYPKQIPVPMKGDDARQGAVAQTNLDRMINDDTRPIV